MDECFGKQIDTGKPCFRMVSDKIEILTISSVLIPDCCISIYLGLRFCRFASNLLLLEAFWQIP